MGAGADGRAKRRRPCTGTACRIFVPQRGIFAAGAVQLLAATGITGYLAFGAETAETQMLAAAAAFINTHQEELRAIIKSGSSYAAAQAKLLQNAGFSFAATEANDILALEYCRCLQKYAPQIAPLVIRRCGAGYNSSDISAEYASASGIRTEYAAGGLSGKILKQIPECSHELLEMLHSLNLLDWNTENSTRLFYTSSVCLRSSKLQLPANVRKALNTA